MICPDTTSMPMVNREYFPISTSCLDNTCICDNQCRDWNNSGVVWCQLKGGELSKTCNGAIKSEAGDFYWSDHSDYCEQTKSEYFHWSNHTL